MNKIGEVPCNGCTECCKGDAVRILPGEPEWMWKTEPHPYIPEARMLAHKPNGECLYLGKTGCTIHANKPRVCREMDCRLIFERVPFAQANALHAQGALTLKVWRKGQALQADCKSRLECSVKA